MRTFLEDSDRRSAVYRLLARIWAEEPNESLTVLAAQPFASIWGEAGGQVPDLHSASVRETLSERYCWLFVGPTEHLPLLQSVWETGELVGDVASSVALYDSLIGFEQPWRFELLPDHLGNQLWRMSDILVKSALLRTSEELLQAADLAGQFFSTHVTWCRRLLDSIIERDGEGFYGTSAAVTIRFLEDEAERLSEAGH